jgi:hypothetical protein
MANQWDTQHPDLLQDWMEQDEADLQARNDKLRSLSAQRDQGLEAARDNHDAKLRELSTESELYAGQKELADKAYEQERKGVNETHAKETSKVNEEYSQQHEANSRMRESLQWRMERELDQKLDGDFNAPAVPPAPKDDEGKSKAETQAAGKTDDDPLKR